MDGLIHATGCDMKSKDQKGRIENKDLEVKQINHYYENLFMYKRSHAN